MSQVSKERIFRYTKTIYSARYYSFLWLIILCITLIVVNNGPSSLPSFLYGIFLKDWSISLVFLSPIFCWQIWSIIGTKDNIKTLELKNHHLLIIFFGILKEKSLQLNYSEIQSLEYSQNQLKHFNFILKSGERKIIKAEIINKEEAFELIQQKIKESK